MAVVPLLPAVRSGSRASTPLPPSEILRIPGTPAQVAGVIAQMINDGWVFDALPVTRGRGMWLVSARRPAEQERAQLRA